MPEDQMPPENYWHSQEHLKDWFASVRQRSKDRAAGMESIPTGEELDAQSDFVDPEVVALRN